MKKLVFLRTALLVLLLTIPGLCWGAGNALIVHDGTAGIEADALANLTTHLTAAGFAVTPNVGVPAGDLSGNKQIWDIRFNNTTPLTGADNTAYITYMAGGGSLFLMGENVGFNTRNSSIANLISSAGGGFITIATPDNIQTIQSPFTGPNAITTVTFLATAGTTASGVGTGTFITKDANGIGGAVVFTPGSLSNATAGTLIVVFDVNYLQAGADADSQKFTDNLIAFLAAPAPLPGSFVTDLLWRHAATGEVFDWQMNGTSKRGQGSLGAINLVWEIQKIGDFNGDGKPDVVWRNKATGEVSIWLMNGTAIASQGSQGIVSFDWEINGIADFNGDGRADILWRNKVSGEGYIWLMNGTSIIGQGSLFALNPVNPAWEIKGVADFNGDGRADILWRNKVSGEVSVWLMNGTTIVSQASLGIISLDWDIQGIADFNGDGRKDILWRNKVTGQVFIWLMNGATPISEASPGTLSDLNWEIKGAADFNGDGKADILWLNKVTGQVFIWLMNGTTPIFEATPASVNPGWEIKGIRDFDGDGKADILWRHAVSGQVYVWLMNGTSIASQGSPATVGDGNWTIVPTE